MLNIIKIAAKLAMQNPKVREGLKKIAIKSYKKAKPIIKKNIDVIRKTSNENSPLKDIKTYTKKFKENYKNYD